MAKIKKIKKAQDGKPVKKVITEETLRPEAINASYRNLVSRSKADYIPGQTKDTTGQAAARAKAIKEGKYREDPKTGDLFPIKKKGGKIVAKKAKSGAALKKQAAKAIAMKKAGKAPKKAKSGMKMGKCKYGC